MFKATAIYLKASYKKLDMMNQLSLKYDLRNPSINIKGESQEKQACKRMRFH